MNWILACLFAAFFALGCWAGYSAAMLGVRGCLERGILKNGTLKKGKG